MARFDRATAVLLVLLGIVAGCSRDKSVGPEPSRGKITAKADGIQGQSGNLYSVSVYAYDWFPGAETPAIAGVRATIPSDVYSPADTMRTLDANGTPTAEPKVFDPASYSVVFFVSVPGFPPRYFAEVRAIVDGDITATAPAWSGWVQP